MKCEAIVLAAGRSTRFGGDKLRAVFQGRPLLHHALDVAASSVVSRVILVGAQLGDAASLASGWSSPSWSALSLVDVGDGPVGMGHSIAAGAAALASDTDVAIILLGDMPLVSRRAVASLVQVVALGASASAPALDGKRGHPVAFAASQFKALRSLNGDAGARRLLAVLGTAVALIPGLGSGAFLDVDVRQDLDKLQTIAAGWPTRMSKPPAAKGAGTCLKHVLNARLHRESVVAGREPL